MFDVICSQARAHHLKLEGGLREQVISLAASGPHKVGYITSMRTSNGAEPTERSESIFLQSA